MTLIVYVWQIEIFCLGIIPRGIQTHREQILLSMVTSRTIQWNRSMRKTNLIYPGLLYKFFWYGFDAAVIFLFACFACRPLLLILIFLVPLNFQFLLLLASIFYALVLQVYTHPAMTATLQSPIGARLFHISTTGHGGKPRSMHFFNFGILSPLARTAESYTRVRARTHSRTHTRAQTPAISRTRQLQQLYSAYKGANSTRLNIVQHDLKLHLLTHPHLPTHPLTRPLIHISLPHERWHWNFSVTN